MYYKIHDRQKFYSTLCQTTKRNQRYYLIQSTQNDSISMKYNSKILAQNKFNTRGPIQNLTGHVCAQIKLLSLEPFLELSPRLLFLSTIVSRRPLPLFCLCQCDRTRVYIDKHHVTANSLE